MKTLAIAFLVSITTSFFAHADHHMGMQGAGVEATAAWARATPGAARAGAAYLTLSNKGTTARRVVGVESGVADKAELHTHVMDGNIMRMRKVDGIDLAPGARVTMKPGGYHVMLMGLHAPLKEGATFPLTLVLDDGRKIPVSVSVRKIGAMGPGMQHDGTMRHNGGMRRAR